MARAAGSRSKVFDWVKAAKRIKEEKPNIASAGLSEDWEYTGGDIYKDGTSIPKEETYTFLGSIWATPQLNLDGKIEPCWKYEDETEWDAQTYWPPEALEILND
jgi:hypothetical protein